MNIPLPPRLGLAATVATAIVAAGSFFFPALAQDPSGDREFGEFLAGECVTCHQISGNYDGIPPIIGWPEATFIHAMEDYRDRTRPNEVMQNIAGRYSDEEIAAMAAYFGSLTLKPQ
ncbi:MAG TPA: c-type cytochrome [Saliniramus sp.]|nr:c-type cytochrome [Saliniramus sp.]